MKTVAVCSKLKWTKKPFEKSKLYEPKVLQDTYMDLFLKAESRNLRFIETNFDWYSEKDNTFKKGWIFDKKLGWKQIHNFKADFIFDKSPLTRKYNHFKKLFSNKHMILNPHYIEELASDKYKTYKLFKNILVPLTLKINSTQALLREIKKIRTSKVVIKPEFGSSGKGLIIKNTQEVIKNPPAIKRNYILQEFVESDKNKKFRFKYGVYDLRIVMSQGKILDSFYRVSKQGILSSNVSTGARIVFIHKNKIPKTILENVRKIDKKLHNYTPRLYTADFVIDLNGKPWLIELNSKPGFMYYTSYAHKKRLVKFENNLINIIKKKFSKYKQNSK